MTPLRRPLPWLVAAALALSPAAALAQGGAGDDQYADPFNNGTSSGSTSSGSSGSGSSSSGSGSGSSSGSGGQSLTNRPPATGTGATGSSTGSAPAPATGSGSSSPTSPTGTSSVASSRQLPRTGFDAPVLALLGAGLLVAGVGLRLRTVDETVF